MYKREGKPDIVLITKPIDFRCGIDSLMRTLKDEYQLSPFDNSQYIFTNKRKNCLKILYWGGAGFWLITYRPSVGKFQWLKTQDPTKITYEQMEWLLNGLDMCPKKLIKEVENRIF